MNLDSQHRAANRLSISKRWFLAVLAVSLLALVYMFRDELRGIMHFLWDLLQDRDSFKAYITSFGFLAPLVFMFFQVGQVIFAPIPGELTGMLGGYIFGWLWGLAYSMCALTLGSIIMFFLGRWLGQSLVVRFVPEKYLDKFAFIMERQGVLTCFIFFVIPGFPKDYLCMMLGMTPIHWRVFLVICGVGRIPGTLMLSLQGAALYQENYWMLLWLILGSLALIGAAYHWRHALYAFIIRLEGKPVPSVEAAPVHPKGKGHGPGI